MIVFHLFMVGQLLPEVHGRFSITDGNRFSTTNGNGVLRPVRLVGLIEVVEATGLAGDIGPLRLVGPMGVVVGCVSRVADGVGPGSEVRPGCEPVELRFGL
jgi:hypothetical protein